MNGLSKIASKTSVAAIALTVGLSLANPNTAYAQSCEPPGTAQVVASGSIIPEIISQATNVITGIANSFTSFIGPITSGLSAVTGLASGSACTTMVSCMGQWFAQLAQTNTNNQTMTSSVIAKGNDYLATNQYTLQLQGAQSQMAIENGVSPSTNGVNGLAYMNNNLCVATTLSEGASEASYEAVGNTVNHQGSASCIAAGTCVNGAPPSPSNPNNPFNPNQSATRNVSLLYNYAQNFVGTTMAANKDVDAAYLTNILVYEPATQNPITPPGGASPITNNIDDADAMNQYTNYIVGLAPEIPPTAAKDPSGQQAFVAAREKLAYYYTARLALDTEAGYHEPTQAVSAKAVNDIYSAAGLPTPLGAISKAELLDAMFKQTAEDPQIYTNISTMNPLKMMQYMASLALWGNYLSYERYLVEKNNLLVNSAALALAYRQANFVTNP